MANTCTTEYVFEGEGAQIRALHTKLGNLLEEKSAYADSNWLGHVAKDILGLDYKKIDCRGEYNLGDIENCPYDDNKLVLNVATYTAWSPCKELFERLAEKYECEVYWMAEELGCELFQTNDTEEKYFHVKIIIDTEEDGMAYFQSYDDAVKYIAKLTGNPNITFSEIEDLDDVYVHEIDYV